MINRNINCRHCGLYKLCLPAMLAEAEIDHLDSIIQRGSSLKKGAHLFNSGEPFEYIYAIRSGALKTYVTSYSGEEQITAFHLPGEIIGFDGINSNAYRSSAVALMDSNICKIPFAMLNELTTDMIGLREQIMRLMSKEITEDQELLLVLGQKPAKERMATVIVDLSSRFKVRNLSGEDFILPMSRSEIANYLGLTIETVSRVIKEFKDNQWLEVNGRQLHITDLKALQDAAGISHH